MRSKKAGLNIIVSIAYQVISTICALIIPRLILSAFGSTYNGVTQSITQLMSMISFLTLGVAGATRLALYKSLAAGDNNQTSRIIKANQTYMNKVGVALLIYTAILAILYPFISHNSLTRAENFALVLIVSLSTISEYFFGITYRTLLMADQREYIYSLMMICARILNAVIVYSLVKFHCNVYIVYLATALINSLVPIVLNIYVSKKYRIDKGVERDQTALQQQGAVAFQSVANIVHLNTDVTLLTLFTDAKVISVYSVYNNVTGKIRMIMRVFTNGLEAAFGNMWAKGEYDNIKNRFKTYEFLMNSFVSIIFSCLAFLILPFVALYTRGVTDIEYLQLTFAVLMVFAEGIYCIREPYVTLVQATGKYEETKTAAGVEAAINILTSLILVWKIGLVGVVIGTITANVFRTAHYIWYSYKKILKKHIGEEIGRLFVLALNISLVLFVGQIVGLNNITSWLNWFTNAIFIFLIACIVTVMTGTIFYISQLQQTLEIVKKMLKQ